MIKLALVGQNISHSQSPQIYKALINSDYQFDLIDITNESRLPSLEELSKKYDGINITSPFKKFYLNQVLEVEGGFKSSINCINLKNRKAISSDYVAAEKIYLGFNQFTGPIVLLGNGPMAEIMKDILDKNNQKYSHFSRSLGDDMQNLHIPEQKTLIINTCSRDFLFKQELPSDSIYWDFNYGLIEQESYFKNTSVTYQSGQELLLEQAKINVRFWGLS
jgi:shikimate 5-dehydrogenase